MSKMQTADRADSRCVGRPWRSLVKDADDGEIEIEDDGPGKIKGTHHGKGGKPITGDCDDKPHDHRIHFTVTTDDGCVHTYDGVIGFFNFPRRPPTFGIIGKVNIKCPTRAAVDEDWVAEKTT